MPCFCYFTYLALMALGAIGLAGAGVVIAAAKIRKGK